jgi:hypothetical protein
MGYLPPPAGAPLELRPDLLPVPPHRLEPPARVEEGAPVIKGRRHQDRLPQVQGYPSLSWFFGSPHLHRQTGFQAPGELVVDDAELPHPFVPYSRAVGDAEGDLAYPVPPVSPQGNGDPVPFYLEAALDVPERGEVPLAPKSGGLVVCLSFFPQGEKGLVGLSHLLSSELDGHGVVVLSPRKLLQDAVEVLAGEVHLPGPFVGLPEVPKQPVVDLGGGAHGLLENGFHLGRGVDLGLEGQEGHLRLFLLLGFDVAPDGLGGNFSRRAHVVARVPEVSPQPLPEFGVPGEEGPGGSPLQHLGDCAGGLLGGSGEEEVDVVGHHLQGEDLVAPLGGEGEEGLLQGGVHGRQEDVAAIPGRPHKVVAYAVDRRSRSLPVPLIHYLHGSGRPAVLQEGEGVRVSPR